MAELQQVGSRQNTVRKRDERGHTRISWLDSYHSFSFGEYYDPQHMGFSDLRVINEDRVEPGQGFATHGHSDMEILTYVLEGTLAHKDSLGNGSLILPGEMQRMTAGTGIRHSEFNPSDTEPVHLLQIWILPEAKGLTPGYEQTAFSKAQRQGQWCLLASREGRDGSVRVHQDVELFSAVLSQGEALGYAVAENRLIWLQVATGVVSVNGALLEAGDALTVRDGAPFQVEGQSREAEVLLFNLRQLG